MNELIIEQEGNFRKIFLIENEKLVEYYRENIESSSIEGNIYLGKVQNVIPGLEAAFINIGNEKNVFIHRKDLLDYDEKLPINKIIKPGEKIVVQVVKDKIQRKGAKGSEKLSLRGRFVVLHPNGNFITVSSKIKNEEKKKELKNLLGKLLPNKMGAIARTTSEYATENEIEEDLKILLSKWKHIQEQTIEECPKILYNSGGILNKIITDLSSYKLDKIVVNTEELEQNVIDILNQSGGNIPVESSNIESKYKYNISNELNRIEKNKIWLDSGGFITIDITEALTAIDVNTGKFIGKKDLEDTIYKVNEEAVLEITKQLRLRDIGGIIIIDFIDMTEQEDKEKIISKFEEEVLKDRSRVQIEGFTKLNLLEITRKRVFIKENN